MTKITKNIQVIREVKENVNEHTKLNNQLSIQRQTTLASLMYQKHPKDTTSASDKEIKFFSEIRNKIYRLADVANLSNEDIDFLLSEAWSNRISLTMAINQAHENIAQGQKIDNSWFKRVKYKNKAVKAFMHGLREEKGLRFISENPEAAAKLREQLIANDTPESDSINKIDTAINAAVSARGRELRILMALIKEEIGEKKFQELQARAIKTTKLSECELQQ